MIKFKDNVNILQEERNGIASLPWMLLTITKWPVLLAIINGRIPSHMKIPFEQTYKIVTY